MNENPNLISSRYKWLGHLRPPYHRRSPYLDHSAPGCFATKNFKTREMQAANRDSESENGGRTLRPFPTGRKFHKKFFIFRLFHAS